MPVAVLYVTGWCRSGSTVLGNILAEVPGVFHAGELVTALDELEPDARRRV